MESRISVISEMRDKIQNALLRAAGAISGCYEAGNDLFNLRGVAKLYNSEDDIGELRKENLGYTKNVADFA